ncbi:MAG: LuxR C-terminal-related transcriptional regulator [Treponema sp.]|jgi:LuxR family maltose regulon positive regulatory protein|nr:LuxR C-terminal-related transcriptional regulator [Treponema sp.]
MDKFYHGGILSASGNQIYLERPRIDQMLEKAIHCPIVLVVAGVGYGKSHAVYSFVRRRNEIATWLQFSGGDNFGERFWEKFVDAISVIDGKAAVQLKEVGFPETVRQFNRYMSVPLNAVIPQDKYIFVYDDIHLIHDKAVLSFIKRSITTPFPNITSIVISRNDTDLNFPKLEAKGKIAYLTQEDLCFSRNEMEEYFSLLGLQPSIQTLSSIYHDTEGWAFAIHLTGLSLKNSRTGDAYVRQALRSNIFKLIESEIIAGMSAELKSFLIKLSLIDHPVPDLLREIAGGGKEDYSLIDEMEQIGSFVQYDTYLNAYRIHQLFLDYLKGRQYELSENEKQEVWSKAADWCLRNNHKIDAINYYRKAGDYYSLLDLSYSFPLVPSRQAAGLLIKSLEEVPLELYEESAAACLIYPRLLMSLEIFDAAALELERTIAKYEGRRESSRKNTQILAGSYNNMGFLGFLNCIYTHDYNYVRYFERAHYYSVISGYKTQPPLSIMNMTSYTCRTISTEAGEMERYIESLKGMALHMTASMSGCGYGLVDLAQTELAFFKGNMVLAEECAQQALTKAREQKQYEIETFALFFLLRIYLSRGNYEAVPGLLQQIDAQQDRVLYLNRFIYHAIIHGWFDVQIGRTEKLAPWLKSDFEESDLNSMILGIEILVKAKYHFIEKSYPAALANLQRRDTKYSAWSSVLGKLEAKTLEAVCRYRLDDNEGAFHELETAWELARTNGLYMPFTELGKDMRALAGAALKEPALKIPRRELEKIRRSAAVYAKNIFTVSEQYRADSSQARKKHWAGAALSPRELDVLAGLSQGLTREEIACVSSISINTVKSTIRSAYNKLGAVNRADAIRIATKQGIL